MACILIIDDEFLFRQVVLSCLGSAGHLVLEAGDGQTAADLLKRFRVDLVLTDVVMPNGDGLEIINHLKLQSNPVPVIAMTGWYSETEIFSTIAGTLGTQRVLRKPFKMETLLAAVEEVLSEEPILRH
jgi:CheY-like chemotaxis protein